MHEKDYVANTVNHTFSFMIPEPGTPNVLAYWYKSTIIAMLEPHLFVDYP